MGAVRHLSVLLVASFASSACAVIQKRVNDRWPPLSVEDQRRAAIESSMASLEGLSEPNVYARLADAEFRAAVVPRIQARLASTTTIAGVRALAFSSPRLSLAEQGMGVEAAFSLVLDEYDLPLAGRLRGEVALSTAGDALIVRPAFSHLRLTSVDEDAEDNLLERLGKKAAVELVDSALHHFVDNLNGALFDPPIALPIRLPPVELLKEKIVDAGVATAKVRQAIGIVLEYGGAALLVEPEGVTLLAEVSASTVAAPRATRTPSSFADLRAKFSARAQRSFPTSDAASSLLVSKELVRGALNEGLARVDVELEAENFIHIPPEKGTFATDIRAHDPQKLPDCSQVRRPFEGYECGSCSQDACNGPCSIRACSCAGKSGLSKRKCELIERPACQVAQNAERAACGACKTAKAAEKAACDAKVAACKTEREARRVVSDLENTARVAACSADKLALKLVDGLVKFGELRGELRIDRSHVLAKVRRIELGPGLQRAEVRADVDAWADTWLRVHVNPEGAGHLACVFSFQKTITPRAELRGLNVELGASMSVTRMADGALALEIVTDEKRLDVDLHPSPYALLVEDPGFALNCSFLAVALPIVAGVELLRKGDVPPALAPIFGDFEVPLRSQTHTLRIGALNLDGLRLMPIWTDAHLGFRVPPAGLAPLELSDDPDAP